MSVSELPQLSTAAPTPAAAGPASASVPASTKPNSRRGSLKRKPAPSPQQESFDKSVPRSHNKTQTFDELAFGRHGNQWLFEGWGKIFSPHGKDDRNDSNDSNDSTPRDCYTFEELAFGRHGNQWLFEGWGKIFSQHGKDDRSDYDRSDYNYTTSSNYTLSKPQQQETIYYQTRS